MVKKEDQAVHNNGDHSSPGHRSPQSTLKTGTATKSPTTTGGKNMLSCKIRLLDSSDFDTEFDRNAKGQDLLDKVAEYLNLLEKDYFSLSYKETVRAENKNVLVRFWLAMDKKITKQIKTDGGVYHFAFEVKFYPPEPSQLKEDVTRYFLCLQVRNNILAGQLPCSFVTLALLGSYTVQATVGNFDSSAHGPGTEYLRDFVFSMNQNEELLEKVANLHQTHKEQTPAEAEMHYLENAKKLAMYGVDLHEAKDSENIDVMVGVCSSGLLVYRDRLRINRFAWPKILKISYKRNNFYIKLRPGEFEQVSSTVVFKVINYRMAKRLWKTAVEHHTFFRLKEADQASRSTFPRLTSKFRYSGRTHFQARQDTTYQDRHNPYVQRYHSGRFTGSRSMDGVPAYATERSEQYAPNESRTTTLDLKGRRKGSVPFADLEDDKNLTNNANNIAADPNDLTHGDQEEEEGDLAELPVSESYDVTVTNTAPPPPTKKKPVGAADPQGAEPERDEFGRIIITKNVIVTVNPKDGQRQSGISPSQEDQVNQLGGHNGGGVEGEWGAPGASARTTSLQRTITTKDGQTVVETEITTNKDGVVETTKEKMVMEATNDEMDYDKMLREAISSVTDMNPDLTVEKIEIQTKTETSTTH